MKLTAEVKEREQLEAQVEELEREEAAIAEKLSSLHQGNDPLKHERQALQAELDKLRREHENEERAKRLHVRWQSLHRWQQ